jgi:hypothetical protein
MIHVVSVPFFSMPFDIARGDSKQVKIVTRVKRVTKVTMTSSKMNTATTTSDTQSSKKERTK